MAGKTYGYARVSSRDQNLDRQLDAFEEFGLERSQVFSDKASGKDFKRPQYQRLMRRHGNGDVLVVKSIDRLGHSYDEIIDEWRRITKEKCVSFHELVERAGLEIGWAVYTVCKTFAPHEVIVHAYTSARGPRHRQ